MKRPTNESKHKNNVTNLGKGPAMDLKVKTLQPLTTARLKKTTNCLIIVTQESDGHLPCSLASSKNREKQGESVEQNQQ